MLDIAYLRQHPERVRDTIAAKNKDIDLEKLLRLDELRRQLQGEAEDLRAQRSAISGQIAEVSDKQPLIEAASRLKDELAAKEPELTAAEDEFAELLLKVPNIMAEDTPIGADESGNQVVSSWGEPTRFDFTPKDHLELGEALGLIDTARAAKVSGARFNFLIGDMAHLQLALMQYVIDRVCSEEFITSCIKRANLDLPATPFTPVVPPMLVRPETMQRMARLEPKEDRFLTQNQEYVLVGSAEHSLGALHMDELLELEELPLRYAGVSAAFRREAGSYGKDTRGILRQHQFDKLELETFSAAATGESEHQLMIAIQRMLMEELELPHQVVRIWRGDMGAPDYMQTDIETWMPAQNTYRETHTADYMTDYQARRLKTRYKDQNGESQFAHMNDATAMAMGRALIAIVENYQTKDMRVRIPEALKQYMNKEEIK